MTLPTDTDRAGWEFIPAGRGTGVARIGYTAEDLARRLECAAKAGLRTFGDGLAGRRRFDPATPMSTLGAKLLAVGNALRRMS